MLVTAEHSVSLTFKYFVGIDFGVYLQGVEKAESKMKYLNRCNKNFKTYNQGDKNIWVSMAILMMILSVISTMFIGIHFFMKRRSASIFGKYQRNCVTLSQTVHFVIVYIIFEVSFASSLNILDKLSISRFDVTFYYSMKNQVFFL